MEKKPILRYSEAFKLQVVDQIERGEFSGVTRAARSYGIKGSEGLILPALVAFKDTSRAGEKRLLPFGDLCRVNLITFRYLVHRLVFT